MSCLQQHYLWRGWWHDAGGQKKRESHLHLYFLAIMSRTVCLQMEKSTEHFVCERVKVRERGGERERERKREMGWKQDKRNNMHNWNWDFNLARHGRGAGWWRKGERIESEGLMRKERAWLKEGGLGCSETRPNMKKDDKSAKTEMWEGKRRDRGMRGGGGRAWWNGHIVWVCARWGRIQQYYLDCTEFSIIACQGMKPVPTQGGEQVSAAEWG